MALQGSVFQLLVFGLPIILILQPLLFLKLPPEPWWSKLLAALAIMASLAALGFVAFVFDDFMATPHSVSFCAVVITVAIASNVPLLVRFRSKVGDVLVALFCVAVIVMDYGDSDLKAFKRAYINIHDGMTEQEAAIVMKVEFDAGSYAEPDFRRGEKNSSYVEYYFPHAPDGKMFNGGYDAFIILKLKDGRVVSKQYDND